MDYIKLPIKQYPNVEGAATDHELYWSKLKSPILLKEFAAVRSIGFSPVSPYDFCVAASTRVQVYSSLTHSTKKTISRFKDLVYDAHIRSDGKLIAVGDASGLIQLFELNSRAILRTLKAHEAAVHVVRFTPDGQILSASDDKSMILWDIASETPLHHFKEHTDYIRAAVMSPENHNIVVSGSYDHSVKVWDVRSTESLMTMDHGYPVEALVMLPGSGLVASAGGNRICIWDIHGGGKLLHSFSNHQKTITSLCLDGTGSYLLSGSLDHHVKIVSLEDYKIAYSLKYPAPVISLAVSPTNSLVVAGMSTGLFAIRKRVVPTNEVIKKQHIQPRGGTFKYFMRGSHYTPQESDVVVESKRKARLQPYDKLLKSFQYSNALDAVLEGPPRPVLIVSMIEELIHRDGLHAALSGRDEQSLQPIVCFLLRYICNPRYAQLLISVTDLILDIYSAVVGQSLMIGELFDKLKMKLEREIELETQFSELVGVLDTIMAGSI